MYWFMQRRVQFRELLNASQSGLTTGRYLRLLGLGLAEVILSLGYNIYFLVEETRLTGLLPWISWENVHVHFGTPHQFPYPMQTAELKKSNAGMFSVLPVSAFAFFLFFAFGEEAVSEYKKNWTWIKIHIFRMDPSTMVGRHGNSTLPSFVAYVYFFSRSVCLHTLDRMTNSHLPHNLENRPPTLITNLSYLLGLRNLLARNGSASPRMTMTIVFSLLGSISKLLDQLNFLVPHSQNSHLNQTVLFHHARISTLHETSTTRFTFHCREQLL